MYKLILSLVVIVFSFELGNAQRPSTNLGVTEKYILYKINTLRAKGCRCSGKRMKPAHALTWNKTLEKSALLHAKEMHKYNFFGHHSIYGKDIGDRLDALGYKWQYVGENLATGQKSFDEAMRDWIKSPSHCKMLMNPNMREVAISKYGKYWVQHFGKTMPKNTRRTRVTYSEGD